MLQDAESRLQSVARHHHQQPDSSDGKRIFRSGYGCVYQRHDKDLTTITIDVFMR